MSDRLTGPELAVVTALIARRGQGVPALAAQTGQAPEVVGEALCELRHRGYVEEVTPRRNPRPGSARFGVTLTGHDTFYRTLREIRDTLAPDQLAPSLPFTVQTVWRECLCFNYLVEPEALRSRVPPVFDLVTCGGLAIVSVTAAALRSIRPSGLPELAGQSFCHITYRAVVRFVNAAGRERIGYDFIASLTNSALLSRIGNSVTEFKFHDFRTGAITFLRQGSTLVLGAESDPPDLTVVATVDLGQRTAEPPASSVFPSRAELDRLVIDHPDAFGHVSGEPSVYVLGIDRDPWNYTFVSPRELYLPYFHEGQPFDSRTARLDSVLHCANVAYHWQPLRREAVAASR